MIPKRIHYCWFSGEEMPTMVMQCIASWHRYMPDWEFVLWDYEKIRSIDSVWLRECLEARKWAFATDFVRLWAVYHEGGVYLDCDVMIYESLEKFRKDSMFIGRESVVYPTFEDGEQAFLTSHCFGAVQGHPFLKLNLAYYQDRHFRACSAEDVPNELRYDMLMMPYIQSRLAEPLGYDAAEHAVDRQSLKMGIEVYPPNYFCWMPYLGEEAIHYAQHLGQGSWREPEYVAKHKLRNVNGYDLAYKIRWRLVVALRYVAKKLDYHIERIHPDGWL